MIPSALRARLIAAVAGGFLLFVTTLVSYFEGERLSAYFDPAGILTVCYGETLGVKPGDTYTHEQCLARLQTRLKGFDEGVRKCVVIVLPMFTRAAVVSLAYNAGLGAVCKSTLVRRINAGERAAACDEFMRWARAKGRLLPGLLVRRGIERELCVMGFEGTSL